LTVILVNNILTRCCVPTPYLILAIQKKKLVQDKLFEKGFDDPKEDKAIGTMLGMAIGDALGAPLEFTILDYSPEMKLQGLEDEKYWNEVKTDTEWKRRGNCNRFNLKPGHWTDDTSMGLCVADSLLVNNGFNPKDLRLRFLNWWRYGYNNAFGRGCDPDGSVGLGGNISESFAEFIKSKTEYTDAGNKSTSGNGSLMRLAPVPIFYHKKPEEALKISYLHSKTTHQGDEAAETCRLMSHIIVKGINGEDKKTVLENLGNTFTTELYSVNCLSKSMAEEKNETNNSLRIEDRRWDWRKSEQYKYSLNRTKEDPTYIGSYAMDALCMALHCLWTTDNFKDCVLKVANLGGDSDTVGSIAGQMAGAFYGASSIPKEWIKIIQKWDNGGDIALKGYKLYHQEL